VRAAFRGGDFGEDFAREAAAAADVEDERGGLEVEELEGALGHGGLDVLDARASGVFAGFGVVVVHVGLAVGWVDWLVVRDWVGGEGTVGGRSAGTYRVSSGRDMMG